MPTLSMRARSLVAALAIGVLFGLSGCTGDHAVAATVQTATHHPKPAPVERVQIITPAITIAADGDSMTAWNGSSPIALPWTKDLSTGPVVVNYSDGWALGGSTIATEAANTTLIHSDVLVVMGGANSLVWFTNAQMLDSLDQLVANSHAKHVLICATAPMWKLAGPSASWSMTEQAEAARMGWSYVNPWVDITGRDGLYLPQYTIEGIHPNNAGSALVADRIADAVEAIGATS